MTDRIKINTERLKGDATEIRQHISRMRSLITDLRSHNEVLCGMWDGPGSEDFRESFERDLARLEDITAGLEEMNGFEENAVRKYEECEVLVSEIADQIQVI